MRYGETNLLYGIKQIVTGLNGDDSPASGTAQAADGGIKVDRPLPLSAVILLVSGTTLKESTVTNYTAVPAIETAAATAPGIGTVSFMVPREYDEASDHLILRLSSMLANADAGVTLTGTATIATPGLTPASKSAVTATAPFTTAAASLGQTQQTVEIKLSGFGLKRDSVVSVALAYAGTLSGVGDIFGVQWHYDSTIVSYNETDATGNATGTLPGFGNPLR